MISSSVTDDRHCEERQRRRVRRSSTSEGGSNPFCPRGAVDCFAAPVIGPRVRADPLARDDDSTPSQPALAPSLAMDVIIYHNPDCGTSRNTLAMIRNAGIEPHV